MALHGIDFTFSPAHSNNAIQVVLDCNALLAAPRDELAAYRTSLGLTPQETAHMDWNVVGCLISLEQLMMNYYPPSLGVSTPGLELKRNSTMKDQIVERSKLSSKFPKFRIVLWRRSSPADTWRWISSDDIQNYGDRVNYLNLLQPTISQGEIGILGKFTQIGIQFLTEGGATLPTVTDKITVQGSISAKIEPYDSKKNDEDETEQLKSRLTALESLLTVYGAPSVALPGTNGLVPAPPVGAANHLLRGDRSWQDPAVFATPADVNTAILDLIGAAPTRLDTLDELARALNNNENFSATVISELDKKQNKSFVSSLEEQSATITTPLNIPAGGALNVGSFVVGHGSSESVFLFSVYIQYREFKFQSRGRMLNGERKGESFS